MGLLLARPPLVESLVAGLKNVPAPTLDTSRLGQGASLESRDEFPLDIQGLRHVFEMLQPVLTNGFTEVRSDMLAIGQAAAANRDFLSETAEELLGDRHERG